MPAFHNRLRDVRAETSGLTTVELMISSAIISVAVLGTISAFSSIAKSVQTTKTKGLASNLAQEKVESLKNLSYFHLMVTTDPSTDTNFDPAITYDGVNGYYPPEVPLTVGGIAFDRRVLVRKVAEKSDGTLEYRPWTDADTGLKEILVYVIYKQGGTWRKTELRNLRDDPNRQPINCTFSGTVRDSGGSPLTGAHVEVIQNPVWDAYTPAGGAWSFQVSAGTYTLQASKDGYFSQSLAQPAINQNDIRTGIDFSLVKMTSGAFSGQGYLRDHLVISQVVASTGPTGLVEYVELYNPTTWAWTLNDASFDLRYVDANNTTVTDIPLNFDNASIPANGGYYLIASTTNFSIAGQNTQADARYQIELDDVIRRSKAGGIQITNDAGTTIYDKVGWSKNSVGASAPSQAVEGTQVTLTNGLDLNEIIFRSSMTYPANPSDGINAWDTNDNSMDFNQTGSPQDKTLLYAPHNSASTPRAPSGGTPAAYAIVFSDDNLSASTLAGSTGFFVLTSVATGAWTINVASASVFQTAIATVQVNNTVSVGFLALTSSPTNGYVTGQVTNALGAKLEAIKVSGAGVQTNTDSNGCFRLGVSTGTVQIVANAGNLNTTYTSEARSVSVNTGQVRADTDFVLSQGGKITGRSTSNGTDAYPGLVIVAKLGAVEQGTAVAGSNGNFTITDLTTGTYYVSGFGLSGESVTPSTFTVNLLTPGSSVSAGTFIVSGALGKVKGAVTYKSSSIQTGVLVVVTTASIVDYPPVINNTVRTGSSMYYSGSSAADGTYSIPVPGGYTYNVYAWYPVSSTTTRKSDTAPVTAGASTTRDFDWTSP